MFIIKLWSWSRLWAWRQWYSLMTCICYFRTVQACSDKKPIWLWLQCTSFHSRVDMTLHIIDTSYRTCCQFPSILHRRECALWDFHQMGFSLHSWISLENWDRSRPCSIKLSHAVMVGRMVMVVEGCGTCRCGARTGIDAINCESTCASEVKHQI